LPNSAINQKNPRQPFFAGVEELIDKIGLGAHAAGQQKLQKQIGECMFVVHHADHLFPPNLERGAGGNRGGRGQTQSMHRASDSSPTKSPAERSVMVASLPACETTVSFALPF
jgi:hypothetical protein